MRRIEANTWTGLVLKHVAWVAGQLFIWWIFGPIVFLFVFLITFGLS